MRQTNAWAAVAAMTFFLTACGASDIVDSTNLAVDVEVLPSAPGAPSRYLARLSADSPATTALGRASLMQKATTTCGDADVSIPTRLQAKVARAATPSIVFECATQPWPNRVAIAAGAQPPALITAPGAGVRRKHVWGGQEVNSQRDERNQTARLLGQAMRDVYLDECEGRGATVIRISSALETAAEQTWSKIHVVVDYRCLETSPAVASR